MFFFPNMCMCMCVDRAYMRRTTPSTPSATQQPTSRISISISRLTTGHSRGTTRPRTTHGARYGNSSRFFSSFYPEWKNSGAHWLVTTAGVSVYAGEVRAEAQHSGRRTAQRGRGTYSLTLPKALLGPLFVSLFLSMHACPPL